jgi:hypothetical protein
VAWRLVKHGDFTLPLCSRGRVRQYTSSVSVILVKVSITIGKE